MHPSKDIHSETNLDDVLQISNVFVNVSKGEVAKSGDLKKAFGTVDVPDVVAEVRLFLFYEPTTLTAFFITDPQERRSPSQREGAGTRSGSTAQGNCHPGGREMCRSFHAETASCGYD